MSDRGSLALLIAAVLCCAAPVLIGTGLAGAAWGVVRQDWGWLAAGVGFVGLVLVGVRRRSAREP